MSETKREYKYCAKCVKITQFQNVGTCRSCHSRKERSDPERKAIIYARKNTYRANNKDKRRVYENNRLKTNPSARLASRFRNWINKLIERKSGNAASLVGCSYDELKIHLESKFQEGMTWENWGVFGWHIDHIKPLSQFYLQNPEQQKAAFHYTNLQPLWWKDNLSKGALWETDRE